MEHPFGSNGPYFGQRGGFHIREAERRAAQVAKEANVKPARLYLRSTSRGMRRAIDIYLPRFMQDASQASSEVEQEDESEHEPEDRPQPAPPQDEKPSYRRSRPYFLRLGSDDGHVRKIVQRIFEHRDPFSRKTRNISVSKYVSERRQLTGGVIPDPYRQRQVPFPEVLCGTKYGRENRKLFGTKTRFESSELKNFS